jgi:SpoIID/LytB domain protein
MSQIGARGQALEGRTAQEILNYYYPGTQVTPYPDNALIRVNIANQISTFNLAVANGKGNFSIYLGDLKVGELAEPFGTYDGTFSGIFENQAGGIVPMLTSPTAKLAPLPPSVSWTIRWEPGTVLTISTSLETNQYAYGQINLKVVRTPITSYMAVTNTLRLHDEYLWGLGEVPSSWPAAALEAQAIAARTYALTKLERVRAECDCNIYNSTRDQRFVGFSKESEAIWGIKWKEAVNRTLIDSDNALVVTLDGKPVNAFYFSSSGGNTQNIKEVWGTQFSYLQGVPDPWSLNMELNRRYALWSRFVSQQAMAQAFSLPDVVNFTIDAKTATGSVALITGYSSSGTKNTLTGEAFRARVLLPSTWIINERPITKVPFIAVECVAGVIQRVPLCIA